MLELNMSKRDAKLRMDKKAADLSKGRAICDWHKRSKCMKEHILRLMVLKDGRKRINPEQDYWSVQTSFWLGQIYASFAWPFFLTKLLKNKEKMSLHKLTCCSCISHKRKAVS